MCCNLSCTRNLTKKTHCFGEENEKNVPGAQPPDPLPSTDTTQTPPPATPLHDHQHSTRGRQQGDFRPFQPASLAGRISFTNRAPLLWNMLPREVQASSSMLVFKTNVLSLLDSPASGKNLLQICFGNTTI